MGDFVMTRARRLHNRDMPLGEPIKISSRILKHNPNFQAHSWHSQSKLLKKNLPEISFIFLSMFFNQHRQTFQWSLCSEDFNSIRAVRRSITSSDVEISESVISSHFGPTATKYVFKVITYFLNLLLSN